ncbi:MULTISPECIES: hypothetical protein [unclassified Streptomyces]|uniref:hypothetical protein n=1 Tax=unclassified Streptomyces TaxID=2593676 RepID=UPI000DC756F5|nr:MULTISPECIES: hypothetical protein [unclassified Streptomyces]AWZ06795.1 hypothetical protein DRB89_21655 [Streptomyces sp. ICC4]AWZ16907.1 hypothetical protein DRB96_37365 [Streptomyces sp. ICC1]
MSYRPRLRLRSALIGACTAALLAGSGLLALPAQAESPSAPAAAAQRDTRPEAQALTFLGYYTDAYNGIHPEGKNRTDVREKYLTKELDTTLTNWAFENQKDPIFRRNEVPKFIDAKEASQANGKAKVVATYSWENGTSSQIWLTVDTNTMDIEGLTDPS